MSIMKNLIIVLLLIGSSAQAYAQDVFFKAKLDAEEVPAAIVEAVEKDFPGFSVTEYAAIPLEVVDEEVFVDTTKKPGSEYDTYQLVLTQGNDRYLDATYKVDGELLSTVEHLKNVTPPARVRNSVAEMYPGWTIEKDAFKMVHYEGKKAKERYKLVLGKDDKKMKVFTDENGKILKVS
ncbi:hypothetical protein D2V05_13335 [Flagellimonas pelagia]|uniref:Beta-lactamase-inhibitor-like PepSY-like domain-containing protein n=2 Tax=Flagellimonas pelagia TaxID=2306998 RepID=A0A3A1NFA6_9FLAO|nr:hypothetical protein D2V05_13335 [Allomuricauda maritima]